MFEADTLSSVCRSSDSNVSLTLWLSLELELHQPHYIPRDISTSLRVRRLPPHLKQLN